MTLATFKTHSRHACSEHMHQAQNGAHVIGLLGIDGQLGPRIHCRTPF